jgi:hypothetical protein
MHGVQRSQGYGKNCHWHIDFPEDQMHRLDVRSR